jgi:hypothetical protein
MPNVEPSPQPLFARLTLLPIAMICLVAISNPAFAADDSYLRSLAAEASSETHSAAKDRDSGNSYLDELSIEAEASASTGAGKNPAANKAVMKMEQLLRSKTPTTYKFYTKLSPNDKAQVFKHYDSDPSDRRLSHIQKNIMDLYFKR